MDGQIFLNATDRARKFKSKRGPKCRETCFINLQNIVCNDFLDGLSFVVNPVFKFKTSSHLINYQQMAVNIAKETFFQNLIILVLSWYYWKMFSKTHFLNFSYSFIFSFYNNNILALKTKLNRTVSKTLLFFFDLDFYKSLKSLLSLYVRKYQKLLANTKRRFSFISFKDENRIPRNLYLLLLS